jgi:hypothetical protein
MSDDVLEDFKQIRISKVTLGLILGVVCFSAVITWNAAQVANRIDLLERSVNGIPIVDTDQFVTNVDLLRAIAAIPPPTPIDLSGLATANDLEDLKDSVTLLLADADTEPEWVEKVEDIEERLEEIGWELGDLWWRTDMGEQACRTKTWCDEWYDDNARW